MPKVLLSALCLVVTCYGCAGWSPKPQNPITVKAHTQLDQSPIGVDYMRPASQVADLTYARRFVLFPGGSRGGGVSASTYDAGDAAWRRYCKGEPLTDAEAALVQKHPMPADLTGRCGILK